MATIGNSSLDSIISAIQAQQNSANQANQVRYDQGLAQLLAAQQGIVGAGGILPQAEQNSRNAIMQAIALSQGTGQSARRRIAQQTKVNQGSARQSAISRGLANTTILDSLQSGVRREANDAMADVDEQVAGRNSQLQLALANNTANFGSQAAGMTRGMAGDISQFIAGRNDVGPSMGQYTDLIQNSMASGVPMSSSGGGFSRTPARRTATIRWSR
jgi:hypothetical protein